jgi:hypothetical protein
MKHLFSLLTISIFIIANSVYSQNENPNKPKWAYLHNEQPDDKYIPYPPINEIKTSPAYIIMKSNFFSTQVNVDANGYNIIGDAANEPSIGIDPTNPNRMVIGWRQFNSIASNFRQAGYGYSTNGGNSWVFPGVIDTAVFRSDPILDCDATGRFFYNSLTASGEDYTCDVFKNIGNTFTWDSGVDAQGGDKQWMVIDQTNSIGSGNIYSNWNWYYSSCTPNNFTRSINHGASFENCVSDEDKTHWGTLAVGPEGELYTVGADDFESIVVSKSTTAKNPANPVTWDYFAVVDLDGKISSWNDLNPVGLLGQAYIDVDHSSGPSHGYVYILASVKRILGGDPGDVMFSRSTNGGLSWSYPPTKINDDQSTSNCQWFGTMSVAPNGRIDAVWLDTRNTPTGPTQSALYYSFSTNQGDTWSVNEQLSDYFDSHVGWPNQEKMGDYFDMLSDNDGAHLAWCGTFNGEEDVYYGHITPVAGINHFENMVNLSLSNYPNPSKDQTTISYILPFKSNVKLVIYDVYGKAIKTLVNKEETIGSHKVVFETNDLTGGVYYCRLYAGTMIESKSLVILK